MTAAEAPTTHSRHTGEAPELAYKCLYYMTLMREVEDRIERKLYRQGKIVGGVYVGRGQEAIPVGTALLAEPDDVLLPSHRDHGRVVHPRRSAAAASLPQYMGRVDGLTRGRDGNMHMGDHEARPGVHHQRAGGHRAGGGGSGPGAALPGQERGGLQLLRRRRHQPRRLARRRQPGHRAEAAGGLTSATTTSTLTPRRCGLQMACANVADRGPAYDMPAEIVDGNDVLAVHAATRRAVDHARAGQRPVPAGMQDLPHDRPLGARRRPLRAPSALRGMGQARPHHPPGSHACWPNGWAERAELDEMHAARPQEVDEAVAWAEAEPLPRPRHPARRRVREAL